MPYKDLAKQREFQRNWMRKRRQEYLADKFCISCGSRSFLQVDHIYPEDKVSHRIWSWAKEKRDAELSKCQVLCHTCHVYKTNCNAKGLNATHL